MESILNRKSDENSCDCIVENDIKISNDSKNGNNYNSNKIKTNRILENYGFTSIRVIGSGTFATVELAYSKQHECNVAIKIVTKDKYLPNELFKHLPREIEVVKGLQHENLITYYQAIETSLRVYIVMEYAEMGSLLDFLCKNDRISESTARKWFKEIVSGVEYCHLNGIVHRDLKCENLLLDAKFSIKLSDFGLARKNMIGKYGNIKKSKTFCGTRAYASPEILKGIPHRPNTSDIWSIGVILYCIVTGTLPFGDSDINTLIERIEEKLMFPRNIKISNACKQMITKLLAPLGERLSIAEIKEQPWFNSDTNMKQVHPCIPRTPRTPL